MTVFLDIRFLIGLGILILILLYAIYSYFLIPWWMMLIKRKKQYKSYRIPSYGNIKAHYDWFKTDEEAIKTLRHRDFIWRVYPGKEEKLKPKK